MYCHGHFYDISDICEIWALWDEGHWRKFVRLEESYARHKKKRKCRLVRAAKSTSLFSGFPNASPVPSSSLAAVIRSGSSFLFCDGSLPVVPS